MIPLRDDNPTRTFACVTLAFIITNAAIFIHEVRLPDTELDAFILRYGLVPAVLTHTTQWADYATVVTSMFLHGSWLHLIGNMLYLWIFGNNIEDAVGHGRYIVFYLCCGLGAAGAQCALDPLSPIPMIGASGAVSGVLGAYLLLYPRARVLVAIPIWIFLRLAEVPAWLMLLLWFGIQLIFGWLGHHTGQTGGIAFAAHVGGFVTGLVLIPLFKKRRVRLFG